MENQEKTSIQSHYNNLVELINNPLFNDLAKSVQDFLLGQLEECKSKLLTSENFKMKYEEISDINMDRHYEYLEDTTGQVDRYTDDDAADDTYDMVWGFFKDLGYTHEEIDEVADNTIY